MKPASLPWLILWELKLAWRGGSSRQNLLIPSWLTIVLRSLVLLVLHAIPAAIFWFSRDNTIPIKPQLLLGLGGLFLAFILVIMLLASHYALANFYERRDLDLLLASPLKLRTVLASRLLGLALSTCTAPALLCLPVANIALVFGHPQALLAYPLLLASCVLGSLPMVWLLFGLVRLFGAQRARRIAQWLSMGVGLLVMVGGQLLGKVSSQLPSTMLDFLQHAKLALFWLGQAMLCQPLPVLSLCAAALLAMLLSMRIGERYFYQIAQLSGNEPASKKPKGQTTARFTPSFGWLIMRKEWRLIVRHPMAINQLILPALLVAALSFGQYQSQGEPSSMFLWMIGMLYCGAASSLCWLAMSLDQTAPLLYGSPTSVERVRRWQFAAILLPLWLTLLLPLLLIHFKHPLQKPGLALLIMVASLAGAIIAKLKFRPILRDLSSKNMGRSSGETILDILHAALWGGACTLVTLSPIGMLCLPLALLIPFLFWMRAQEREYLYD